MIAVREKNMNISPRNACWRYHDASALEAPRYRKTSTRDFFWRIYALDIIFRYVFVKLKRKFNLQHKTPFFSFFASEWTWCSYECNIKHIFFTSIWWIRRLTLVNSGVASVCISDLCWWILHILLSLSLRVSSGFLPLLAMQHQSGSSKNRLCIKSTNKTKWKREWSTFTLSRAVLLNFWSWKALGSIWPGGLPIPRQVKRRKNFD